jgi:hypothetical protein
VGGEDTGQGAFADDQLNAIPGDAGVVRILRRAVTAPLFDDLGVDMPRYP